MSNLRFLIPAGHHQPDKAAQHEDRDANADEHGLFAVPSSAAPGSRVFSDVTVGSELKQMLAMGTCERFAKQIVTDLNLAIAGGTSDFHRLLSWDWWFPDAIPAPRQSHLQKRDGIPITQHLRDWNSSRDQ